MTDTHTATAAPGGGRRRRSVWRLVLGSFVAVALAAALVSLSSPSRTRAVAIATVADALGLPVVRPFAASFDVRQVDYDGIEADRYDPGGTAPTVVLLPGAAPGGREDPRVVQLAEALARADRVVVVPALEVFEQELLVEDVDRIVRVTAALADEGAGPVLVVGASFGGSLGLLAAADERLDGRLAGVATFGAYADLFGVLQAATTGVSLVGDRAVPWDPHPLADELVRERLADELPDDIAPLVVQALAGERDVEELPADARAVVDLLTHDDPTRTDELVAALPAALQRRVREVSPASVAGRLDVPVLAMHSTQDPAIPYGELLRLGEAFPHAELVTLQRFAHVDIDLDSPRSWGAAFGDLRAVWGFVTDVLLLQED